MPSRRPNRRPRHTSLDRDTPAVRVTVKVYTRSPSAESHDGSHAVLLRGEGVVLRGDARTAQGLAHRLRQCRTFEDQQAVLARSLQA